MKQKINDEIIIPKRYNRILKIMKISTLFFFLCTFCVLGENIFSQSNVVSLNLKNVAIKDAIFEIEKETGYVFIFNEDVEIKMRDRVTIDTQNKTIETILTQLLKERDLNYSIIGKQITIYVKNKRDDIQIATTPVPLKIELQQQGKTIKGKVIDERGESLPGVTVVVKGTSMGTTTDIDGNYILHNIPGSPVIIFSFVGMYAQEITVGNRTTINITMKEETISLGEVVAVGYGVQRKESVVGAISQASSKELTRKGYASDFKQALAGQLPGLVTITSSGEPGGVKGESATSIFIRGQNTWNGGQPLILVDGVERDMSNVDVNEVQSISILKDASATAVFGVKGANGVILITTKRGEEGKTNISFSYNTTAQMLSKVPETLESFDAIQIRNLAIERETPLNEPSWLDYIPYEISTRYKSPRPKDYEMIYPNVDWEKAMFKDVGFSHKATVSASGGNKFVRFFGSLAYLHEGDMFKGYDNHKGYNPNYNFDRFNFRSNLDFQVTKTTNMKMNLSGYYSQKNSNYNGTEGSHDYLMWQSIYFMPPDVFLPQYPDGRWGWTPLVGNLYNPVSVVNNVGVRKLRRTQLNIDVELIQKLDFITKGLSTKAVLNYDNAITGEGGIYDSTNSVWPLMDTSNTPFAVINPMLYTGPDQDPSEYTTYYPIGGLYKYDWVQQPWTIRPESIGSRVTRRLKYQIQLNYLRQFGLHNITAMGVFTRDEYASGDMFKNYREDWAFRTTYDYDTRYLLEINGAYNGSEQFGPKYRFDFFPSIGIGWNISSEKFFNIDWMNKLKLRYSLGYVGDDRVNAPRWLYSTRYSYGGASRLVDNISSTSPYLWYKELAVGNPDIHWEKAQKQNYGAEVGLLDNLVTVNFEYFKEKRTDILLAGGGRSIPDFFGATPAPANVGQVNSGGYELELKFNKRFRELYLWSSFALTHAKNEIKFADDPVLFPDYQKKQGFPIGQIKTQLNTGFYNNWDEVYASVQTETNDLAMLPGYYDLLDFNADGVINSFDAVPYGYSEVPQNTFNGSLGFEYKNFSIMAQLYGVTNVSRVIPLMNFAANTNVVFDHVRDYWSKENQNATSFLPRWKTQGENIGDYYLYDASYIRLKTVELAYLFNRNENRWLDNSGITSLRLYVNGDNLFFWSKLPDDREAAWSGGSANTGAYPTVKRINFGINLTF